MSLLGNIKEILDDLGFGEDVLDTPKTMIL